MHFPLVFTHRAMHAFIFQHRFVYYFICMRTVLLTCACDITGLYNLLYADAYEEHPWAHASLVPDAQRRRNLNRHIADLLKVLKH